MNVIKFGFWFFLVGAVLGPVGDSLHVLSRTTVYAPDLAGPRLWILPFWVPLLFGAACLAIGLGHVLLDALLGAPVRRLGSRSAAEVSLGIAVVLILWASSAFLPLKTGGGLDMVIACGALAAWAALDRTWRGIFMGAATAIAGTLVEILLIHRGVFSYIPPKDNFLTVASWLPWLYFAASVAMGNLERFLREKEK